MEVYPNSFQPDIDSRSFLSNVTCRIYFEKYLSMYHYIYYNTNIFTLSQCLHIVFFFTSNRIVRIIFCYKLYYVLLRRETDILDEKEYATKEVR